MFNSDFYNLTQEAQGAIFQAGYTLNPIPPANPNPLLQLRRGHVPSARHLAGPSTRGQCERRYHGLRRAGKAPEQSRWGKDCREVPWGSMPGPGLKGLKGLKGFKEFMG